MREGYGPGEALEGFSEPAAFTATSVAGVPESSGVHVVWDEAGRLQNAPTGLEQEPTGPSSSNADPQRPGNPNTFDAYASPVGANRIRPASARVWPVLEMK